MGNAGRGQCRYVWAPFYKDNESGFCLFGSARYYIEEPFRRQGLARAIYEEAEKKAKSQGAAALRAGTGADNIFSRLFHEKLGFLPYRFEFEKKL
jgi:GNAT superfamily N-acetyltransferase